MTPDERGLLLAIAESVALLMSKAGLTDEAIDRLESAASVVKNLYREPE